MRNTWTAAIVFLASACAIAALIWRGSPMTDSNSAPSQSAQTPTTAEGKHELATFGAGCFWCTEAVFQQLKGVQRVVSGYTGGQVPNPTYEQVCTGTTGHAEGIQIEFDPAVISYQELLEAFWLTHDPTTLNRQGHDVGTQYRSAIFYHSPEQRATAEALKHKLDESKVFGKPIVTEITPASVFYTAEQYHQNYFNHNERQPYCSRIIRPKVDKIREVFKEKLR